MSPIRQRKYFGVIQAIPPTTRTRGMFGAPAPAPPKDPEPEPAHEYSNTQFQISGRPAEMMARLAKQIDPKDLKAEEGASYGGSSSATGIETEPHITARWGLHFQTPSKKLREAIAGFGPVTVTLKKTSLFSNDDADVLKVDVDSPDLHRLYKLLGRIVPVHTTHPVYHPHATIAYLKPGRGKRYAGDRALEGQKIRFDSILFSGRKGYREILPLTSGKV